MHSFAKKHIAILTCMITPITLACAILPGVLAEPEYHYDDLPAIDGTDAAIAEYQAISQWDKLEIAYFFNNDT